MGEGGLIEGGEGLGGLLAQAGGVCEACLFGAEAFVFAGLGVGFVDFGDFVAEAVDEAFSFAGVGLEGLEAAANVAQLADEGGELGVLAGEAGEFVEGGELGCRAEDGELLGLSMDIEEGFGDWADVFEASGLAVATVGGAAGEGDGAFDGGGAPGEGEGGADGGAVGAVGDNVAAGAGTEDEGDGVDEEGFAGAGFAGEDGEPGGDVDGDLSGDGEGGDFEPFKHCGSWCWRAAFRVFRRVRRRSWRVRGSGRSG